MLHGATPRLTRRRCWRRRFYRRRGIPITLQSLTAGQSLSATLAEAMSPKAIGARAAAASCAEVAQDGVVLYQDHPDLPVLPASNMKLLTATALLDELGPNYTFTTALRALHGSGQRGDRGGPLFRRGR